MTRHERVLSDDWLPLEFKSGNDVEVTSVMVNKPTLKSIIEQVEQTVLKKQKTIPPNTDLEKVIENELVVIGKTMRDYSSTLEALNAVVDWNIKLAIDPSTNGGWQLVPKDPTDEMVHAIRTGSFRDWPSDELCKARYAALLAAATK